MFQCEFGIERYCVCILTSLFFGGDGVDQITFHTNTTTAACLCALMHGCTHSLTLAPWTLHLNTIMCLQVQLGHSKAFHSREMLLHRQLPTVVQAHVDAGDALGVGPRLVLRVHLLPKGPQAGHV